MPQSRFGCARPSITVGWSKIYRRRHVGFILGSFILDPGFLQSSGVALLVEVALSIVSIVAKHMAYNTLVLVVRRVGGKWLPLGSEKTGPTLEEQIMAHLKRNEPADLQALVAMGTSAIPVLSKNLNLYVAQQALGLIGDGKRDRSVDHHRA